MKKIMLVAALLCGMGSYALAEGEEAASRPTPRAERGENPKPTVPTFDRDKSELDRPEVTGGTRRLRAMKVQDNMAETIKNLRAARAPRKDRSNILARDLATKTVARQARETVARRV